MNNGQREGWSTVIYDGTVTNGECIYFGEVLLDTSADEATEVLVQVGGNASAAMWTELVKAVCDKGSTVAVRMKVRQTGKAVTERGAIVQELARMALRETAERVMQGDVTPIVQDEGGLQETAQ